MNGRSKLRGDAAAKHVEAATDRAIRKALGRRHRFMLIVFPGAESGEIAMVTNAPELASPAGCSHILRVLPANAAVTIQHNVQDSIDAAVDLAICQAAGRQHPFLLIVLPIVENDAVTLYSNSPDLQRPQGMNHVRYALETAANDKPPMH